MKFYCSLLLSVAAFSLVGCIADDQFCTDVKSFVDKSYTSKSALSKCQSTSTECQDKVKGLGSKLQSISNGIFNSSIIYKNKKYLISNLAYLNADDAMAYCKAFGGYLAEIDDVAELNALKNFVSNSPVERFVMIAGSDAEKEDTWIFPRTGKPLMVPDWFGGKPVDGGNEDCVGLYKAMESKMNDIVCYYQTALDRFMCEVPNDF